MIPLVRTVSALAAVLCLLGPVAGRAQSAQKGPIHGLVTMGRLPFVANPSILPDNSFREANAHPGIYSAVVILATWSQLEPVKGQFEFGAIEQALANIRSYNRNNPSAPVVGKLRVFGGPDAPDWAKSIDGGPVSLSERDIGVETGHFWSPPYRAAWKQLQDALAARYDANPLIAEVAISSCASTTAEPFIIPLNPANLPVLMAAGYSDEAMQQCLMGAIDDYAAWQHVALDYTFNPWRSIASGRPRPDTQFTAQVMEAFRSRYGARGVLANHGLTPEINPPAQIIFDEMRKLGGPIEFQTRAPNTNWEGAVQQGEAAGMTELEIWDTRDAGGPAPVDGSELRSFRSQLAR